MNENNIINAKIDEDSLSLLTTAFELYNISKSHNNIYKNRHDVLICMSLIKQYYKRVEPNYRNMIRQFKRKYIVNEALVEKNDTPEERRGVAYAYDYITKFDVDHDPFSIFVEALHIHSLLYKPLDQKRIKETQEQMARVNQLYEEARREKDLVKFKQAREMAKNLEPESFGGRLRTGPAVMRGFSVKVPSAEDACRIFNSYLSPEKVEEYERAKRDPDICNYIGYCVRTTADLIALQPFSDGNKRTFRILLNLMFKERNLPPVYIIRKERKVYHEALEKAVCQKDYSDLITFYYFKVCDSIYQFDFEPYLKYLDGLKSKEKEYEKM